jgi:ankyrin repeat protein
MTCAAYYGHTDVIRELIENGADVNLVRMDGTSPLWLAANAPDDGGEPAAVELLESGAKADVVGSRGGTALHGAAFHGREKLASALVAAGCPVNAVNSKTSYTALHTAAETKHPKVRSWLAGWLAGWLFERCGADRQHTS